MAAKPRSKAPAKKKRATKPKKKPPLSTDAYLKAVRELAPKDHDGEFASFSDMTFAPVEEYLSTGVFALDKLLGGGWPIGRMVELAAWEGIGKSTLLDQSIAYTQSLGGKCALIDTESARHVEYMKQLGVDLDTLMRVRVDTVEGCFQAIELLLTAQEQSATAHELSPLLIVWDSIGSTPTMAEIAGSADDAHMMVAARNIKMNLRRIHNRLYRCRASLVCANHFYKSPGRGFTTLETYGGSGLKYVPSFRLRLVE